MKIYISGPITGTTDYMERFAAAESKLVSRGHEVINPAKVNAQLPKSTTYDQYMAMCYVMLDMADKVYMLPGWEKSPGAKEECKYAKEKNKPIGIFEIKATEHCEMKT